MKLFITNKDYFQEMFDDVELFGNSKNEPLTSSQIHKKLFGALSKQIDIDNSIPLCLFINYNDTESVAIFDFITKKGDVYYYQFSTTAS